MEFSVLKIELPVTLILKISQDQSKLEALFSKPKTPSVENVQTVLIFKRPLKVKTSY